MICQEKKGKSIWILMQILICAFRSCVSPAKTHAIGQQASNIFFLPCRPAFNASFHLRRISMLSCGVSLLSEWPFVHIQYCRSRFATHIDKVSHLNEVSFRRIPKCCPCFRHRFPNIAADSCGQIRLLIKLSFGIMSKSVARKFQYVLSKWTTHCCDCRPTTEINVNLFIIVRTSVLVPLISPETMETF